MVAGVTGAIFGIPIAAVLSAFFFGFRHGIDWDHIAAITDITSTTTVSAASPIESAVEKFRPLSFSIRFPSSTLVPSMRMTIGTGTPSSLTAAITP